MDEQVLRERIDHLQQGDLVYVHVSSRFMDKHYLLRYKNHTRDYSKIKAVQGINRPSSGLVWLVDDNLFGKKACIDIPSNNRELEIEAEEVYMLTNDSGEARDHAAAIGKSEIAKSIEDVLEQNHSKACYQKGQDTRSQTQQK